MLNLNSVISYFDKWVSPSISDDPDLKLGRSTSELSQTVDRREGYTSLSPSTSYLSIPFSLFIAIRFFTIMASKVFIPVWDFLLRKNFHEFMSFQSSLDVLSDEAPTWEVIELLRALSSFILHIFVLGNYFWLLLLSSVFTLKSESL